MAKLQDRTGERHGRLVLGRSWREDGVTISEWTCDCGATGRSAQAMIRQGQKRSCGCLVADTRVVPPPKDLTGRRFGRLTAIERTSRKLAKTGGYFWLCRCDCGTMKEVHVSSLSRDGGTRSCGCLHADSMHALAKHGMTGSAEMRAWAAMKQRCLNPKNKRYADYGGRGITVHPDWVRSFERFFADVGPRPSPTHSLNRIDNNAGYEPGNVAWATRAEQRYNRRNTRPGITEALVERDAKIAETRMELAKARAEIERLRAELGQA